MNTTTIKKIFQALSLKAALAGFLISNPVNAAIIYDQPGSSLPGQNSGGLGIYDDFQLGSDFILTRFEWTGGIVSIFSPPPPDASPFLWGGIAEDDSSGQPDGPAIVNFTDADTTEVFISRFSLPEGGTAEVYQYSVDLSTPVALEAGQRYWLGINGSFPSIPDSTVQWHWASGTGGNSHALRYEGFVPRTPLDSDFSFTLIGEQIPTSVPEPNMLLL